MKKLALMLMAIMAFSIYSDAQILNNILNSAKKQTEKSVEKQVDKKIDEGVSKLFNMKKKDQAQPAQEAGWVCPKCGKAGNTGNFCAECGAKRPGESTWICPQCGHAGNTGNFCAECGAKRPDLAAQDALQQAQNDANEAMQQAALQLAAQQAAMQAAAEQTASEKIEAANSYAEQFTALQALGVLTPEELSHLMRIGKELEPLTDEQVEAWMMAHPDELAFFLSLQMKMAAAQYGATNTNGK